MNVVPELEGINGVAQVDVNGSRDQFVKIVLNLLGVPFDLMTGTGIIIAMIMMCIPFSLIGSFGMMYCIHYRIINEDVATGEKDAGDRMEFFHFVKDKDQIKVDKCFKK